MDNEIVIDCTGLCCHLPVMRIHDRLKTVGPGQRVRIVHVESGGKNDVEAWIRMTGQEVADRGEADGEFEYLIVKNGGEK